LPARDVFSFVFLDLRPKTSDCIDCVRKSHRQTQVCCMWAAVLLC
jgi:hypothetical protein